MGFIKKGILGQLLKHFLLWLGKTGIIANSYRILHGRKTLTITFSYYLIHIFFFIHIFIFGHERGWMKWDWNVFWRISKVLRREIKWTSLSLLFRHPHLTSLYTKVISKMMPKLLILWHLQGKNLSNGKSFIVVKCVFSIITYLFVFHHDYTYMEYNFTWSSLVGRNPNISDF